MELRLTGDEASDYLNFVVKDEDAGTWYDLNGTNFQVCVCACVALGATRLGGLGLRRWGMWYDQTALASFLVGAAGSRCAAGPAAHEQD